MSLIYFAKAVPPGADPIEEALSRLAASLEPSLRVAFMAMVEAQRDRIDLEALEEALRIGNLPHIMAAVGVTSESLAAQAFMAAVDAVAVRGGAAMSGLLATELHAEISFNALNPNVITHFDKIQGTLIRRITNDSRVGVMRVVRDTTLAGVNPAVAARQIKTMVGLSERMAIAVDNYRAELERGAFGAAQARGLRDARFDLKTARALTSTEIDARVQRYIDRGLRNRAETIARTEAIRALQAGSYESMQQAVVDAKLPAMYLRRYWIVARDERTCPVCLNIAARNAQGVGLNSPFATDAGTVLYPPVHPNCRCAVVMKLELPDHF